MMSTAKESIICVQNFASVAREAESDSPKVFSIQSYNIMKQTNKLE